jgi:hypothetical protein
MGLLSEARPIEDATSDSSAFFRIALWIGPQLVALAISVFRLPLWARFPQPGEWLALPVMLAVQSGVAALLLPILDDWSIAGSILAAGWPMALIAGSLSATPVRTAVECEMYLSLWIMGLAVWSRACAQYRGIACAIAACWSIGGALLVYLRAEFAPAKEPLTGALAGPLVASIQIFFGGAARSVWFWPICTIIIGIAIPTRFRMRKPRSQLIA